MTVKVLIGVSSGQLGRFVSFFDSLYHMQAPPGTQTIMAKSGSCYVNENREAISEHAVKGGFTHVLFLDDDHVFAPHTLLQLLRCDRDIVSGLYLKREQPFVPVAYDRELADGAVAPRFLMPMEHGLVKVKAVGAGCLLVKTGVLKHLTRPWWRREHLGEDVGFCQRARAAGYEVFVDTDTPVGHTFSAVLWPVYNAEGPEAGTWSTVMLSGRPGDPPMAAWPQITPDEAARAVAGAPLEGNGGRPTRHPELVR
jgi:hypothetical protein